MTTRVVGVLEFLFFFTTACTMSIEGKSVLILYEHRVAVARLVCRTGMLKA